jgi:hypothetical protein
MGARGGAWSGLSSNSIRQSSSRTTIAFICLKRPVSRPVEKSVLADPAGRRCVFSINRMLRGRAGGASEAWRPVGAGRSPQFDRPWRVGARMGAPSPANGSAGEPSSRRFSRSMVPTDVRGVRNGGHGRSDRSAVLAPGSPRDLDDAPPYEGGDGEHLRRRDDWLDGRAQGLDPAIPSRPAGPYAASVGRVRRSG